MSGPLEGVRVVELGVWVAGPAAGGLLADWGADVVKIEPVAGDPARGFAKMLGGDVPFNPPFEMDNRSKRSIVLDLAQPAGMDLAHQLLDGADAFVTNIRLDALERLGLDPATLGKRYPRLVYGIITGYGTDGPERDRAAYDIGAFWARSGIAALLTHPGAGPPFQRGGMGDHGAGMTLAAGICAALLARARTDRGQLVSTSLLRHGMYTISFDLNTALRFGVPLAVGTRETMGNPVINCYQDRDKRWFWLIGLEGDRHWPDLCRAIDRPEWITDPRFVDGSARRANLGELIPALDEIFATRDRQQWGEAFDREDLWWAPVQNTDEVLADPQAWAGGGFVEVPDDAGAVTMINTPLDFADTPGAPRAMPPDLGGHTDELLAELGHDEAAITRLRTEGVVAVSDNEAVAPAVETIREFFDAIYRLDFDAAVEFFTDDGQYHDMPLLSDPTVGKPAIRKKLDFMIAGGVDHMTYEIRHLLGEGDVVLCERSETWHFPSGAEPTLRVMCTIELRDGKIASWREYWNQAELMDAMPPEFFAGIQAAEE